MPCWSHFVRKLRNDFLDYCRHRDQTMSQVVDYNKLKVQWKIIKPPHQKVVGVLTTSSNYRA